jgi:hypothetical protein
MALAAVAAGLSTAQAQSTYPDVKVTGRLQEQFYWFDHGDYPALGTESNIFTRRARIEARGHIAENVSFYIQPSFEGGRTISGSGTRGGVRLRDAWIDVRMGREDAKGAFYLRAGQEKRPFSRCELTSSTNLVSIERGAGAGLLATASNDLFGANGFISHDVGASARYEYRINDAQLVTAKLGVYNGQGESLNDANNRKSFGARVTAAITPKLDVGGSWFSHDGIVTVGGVPDSSFTNDAWGVDAQFGKPGDEGLYLLGEYLRGTAATDRKPTIQGIQGLAAYHYRLTSAGAWLYAVEPALRIDVADPDTDTPDDRSTLMSAVLGLYLSSKAQFRVAYERQSFQGGAPSIAGVRTALTVNF